jgi:hypothetical protein
MECYCRLRVFENRALRRILGAKRDGVTGEWRKVHNEELNDRFCSPNIVQVIKCRRMRWACMQHVWSRREEYTGFWWGILRKRDHLEYLGIDGSIILKLIFRKSGTTWHSIGTVGGHL